MSTARARLACFVFALVILGATVVDVTNPHVANARPSRPNVVIIVTDDQPLETYSAMSEAFAWLTESGTEFPNAYVSTPQCCPSRATIMTGLYAHNHGVRDTSSALALDHDETLQRYLHDAGYRTGYFGKYLNSWPRSDDPPYFDDWAIHRVANYDKARWNINGDMRRIARYNTTFLSRRASRFLREGEKTDDSPWLMYLATDAPHSPFVPQDKYKSAPVEHWDRKPDVLEDDPLVDPTLRSDKPQYIKLSKTKPARGRVARRRQLRTLMSVNDMILELRAALARHDETRDTLIVFTSDNGYSWGQHGWLGKAVPYSPSIRVPLVVRWPALTSGVADGDDRLVGNVDIAPTVLDATGITPDSVRDGRSLLDPTWQRTYTFSELWNSERGTVPRWASVRSFRNQYIEYYDAGTNTVTFREYYDLEDDPWQLVNLLGDDDLSNDPALVTQIELARLIQTAQACRGTSGPLACP